MTKVFLLLNNCVRYNAVFRVLLAVRRAQVFLQQVWHAQICSKLRTVGPLWQLRIHMSFLIDNLQYYVQVGMIIALARQMWSREQCGRVGGCNTLIWMVTVYVTWDRCGCEWLIRCEVWHVHW